MFFLFIYNIGFPSPLAYLAFLAPDFLIDFFLQYLI